MFSNPLTTSTAAILHEPENHSRIYDELYELHLFYASLSGISAAGLANDDIFLASGNAIGPAAAAKCLLEFTRTTKFVRGVHQAILHQQKLHPGERIHILYAGCGPYATLLTPMTTQFGPDELAFTLLDINATSLDAVKMLYAQLGRSGYVREYLLADATSFTLPPGENFHIVISETMDQALQREPQVQIMQHLAPQLNAGAVFIPQKISITARLTSTAAEIAAAGTGTVPQRRYLGPVYVIGQEDFFPAAQQGVAVPVETGDYHMLSLFTEITVFGDEVLTANECSLTVPLPICAAEEVAGKEMWFRYVMGREPGFEFGFF